MSLQIVQQDGASFALIDETGAVGWLRPDAIGFRGFPREADALRAAALAHAILTEALARRSRVREPLLARPFGPITWTTNDECYVGARRVGRFLRPFPVPGIGPDSFGFEISLPDGSHAFREPLAHRLHKALAALRAADDPETLGVSTPPSDAQQSVT